MSYKVFLWAKQNLTVLKKCPFFSYSLLPKILKFRRSSWRLVFLIKIVYNQFLLLKNYRLWHRIRSFIWFIIFDWPTKPQIPNWSGVQLKFYKVWCKKGSVKKRKTSNNRSRVFEIALEGWREWKGGGNGNFSWESFNHSMLKATFSKHWLVKLAWHVCTYSLKFKIWYNRNDCS